VRNSSRSTIERVTSLFTRALQSVHHRRRSSDHRTGVSLETLEVRRVLDASLTALQPSIGFTQGTPLYIGIESTSTTASPITYTASSSNPNVTAEIVTGGRSLRLNVTGRDSMGANFTGDITLRLFEDLAPNTTARIIQLASSGFYNGLLFHRVIPNFVVQGGDPQGNGSGGSGTQFSDEFQSSLTFNSQGLLAMANSGDDTNDSQFFITAIDQPLPSSRPQHLNYQHTIYGIMTSGFDTYRKLIGTPTGAADKPITNAVINTATVLTDSTNAVVKVTGPATQTASATITVNGTDGSGPMASRSTVVSSSIASRNNRSFLGTVSDLTTNRNSSVSFTVTGFDTENEALTFSLFSTASKSNPDAAGSAPANFTFSKEATTIGGLAATRFTITPNSNFTGNVDFLVGVRDTQSFFGDGLPVDALSHFDTEEIRLTVNATAFTQAVEDSIAVNQNGGAQVFDIIGNDVAAAGTTLTVQSVTGATRGTATLVGNQLRYTPNNNATGTDVLTYVLRDSSGGTSNGTINVFIAGTSVTRLRLPSNGNFLFTTSQAEIDSAITSGYINESTSIVNWRALTQAVGPAKEVFRVFNKRDSLHYLTLSAGERDFLTGLIPQSNNALGWRPETSGLFLFESAYPGTVEILHLYNRNNGSHLFTDNPSVRASLLAEANSPWESHTSLGFAFPVRTAVAAAQAAAATAQAALSSTITVTPASDPVERFVGLAVQPVSKPVSAAVTPAPNNAPEERPADPISGGRVVEDELAVLPTLPGMLVTPATGESGNPVPTPNGAPQPQAPAATAQAPKNDQAAWVHDIDAVYAMAVYDAA
jgi:cyclophilin family peptidyl-prolyl cis-trans isomerase